MSGTPGPHDLTPFLWAEGFSVPLPRLGPIEPQARRRLGLDTPQHMPKTNAPSFPRPASPRPLDFQSQRPQTCQMASPALDLALPASLASEHTHPSCHLLHHLVQTPLTWALAAPHLDPRPSCPPSGLHRHPGAQALASCPTEDTPRAPGPLVSPPGFHRPPSSHSPSFLPQDICTCNSPANTCPSPWPPAPGSHLDILLLLHCTVSHNALPCPTCSK